MTTIAADWSLITRLGVIEGEILTYLETHGATSVRRLMRELEWPAPMVMMAVGGLVREGLARAIQHELEVIIEACIPPQEAGVLDGAPEVWGG
jgi:hypothetical protein